MAKRKLLTNGNTFKRTDTRWGGTIWYQDEWGKRKRKGFCGRTKADVSHKITAFIETFDQSLLQANEANMPLKEVMQRWLELFKYQSIEQTSYDRAECSAKNQVYPWLGDMPLENVTAADLQNLLNHLREKGYAYTTVKKAHTLLNEFFRNMVQQDVIAKNPMNHVPMFKRPRYMAAQGKDYLPENERVIVFEPEEIEAFKTEAFRCWDNGKRIYQQVSAYLLMLNTGLRPGEVLALQNRDVDLDRRVLHVRHGIKEVYKREGVTAIKGREIMIGNPKSASSKRDVPLNQAAINAILDLRKERYFGEEAPLVCNKTGGYTKPVNFRKRFYRILDAAGIPQKGLHCLRHTFATNLVNGIRMPNGELKSLSPRQVADLLGHGTSQVTEMYYVKKDTSHLGGITNGFEL